MTTNMTKADDFNDVTSDDVSLVEMMLGYTILVDGERAGVIKGVLGRVEHITVEMNWERKGVARAALNRFIDLSRFSGCSDVTTNNATHPAMEHILETEGFEPRSETFGWIKKL